MTKPRYDVFKTAYQTLPHVKISGFFFFFFFLYLNFLFDNRTKKMKSKYINFLTPSKPRPLDDGGSRMNIKSQNSEFYF